MAKKGWMDRGADGLTFGERLEDLLADRGISQAKLAKETGIIQSAISGYISGKRINPMDDTRREYRAPDCGSLIALANYFGVSTDYLLGLSKVKTSDNSIQAACNVTGLSEKAIKHLQHNKSIIHGVQSPLPFEDAEQSTTFLQMLSMLISHPHFFRFVCDLSRYSTLHNSGTSGVITMDDGKSIWAGEVAAKLEEHGWSILSNIHAADYWLYSSLDTLRGIAKDIWEEPWIYGENSDK